MVARGRETGRHPSAVGTAAEQQQQFFHLLRDGAQVDMGNCPGIVPLSRLAITAAWIRQESHRIRHGTNGQRDGARRLP